MSSTAATPYSYFTFLQGASGPEEVADIAIARVTAIEC